MHKLDIHQLRKGFARRTELLAQATGISRFLQI
jgi:hypothetical protein